MVEETLAAGETAGWIVAPRDAYARNGGVPSKGRR